MELSAGCGGARLGNICPRPEEQSTTDCDARPLDKTFSESRERDRSERGDQPHQQAGPRRVLIEFGATSLGLDHEERGHVWQAEAAADTR
jgi:hypothetical protein